MPTIAFHTLGCKLNFAESSNLLRKFVNQGFTESSFKEKCDVYVINTCTVTKISEKKCKLSIKQAHNLNPQAIIAVIGCFSQVNSKEIEKIEGVNIILGNDNKHLLVDRVLDYMNKKQTMSVLPIENDVIDISSLKTFYTGTSFDDRTRGFLKIQDGCDCFCTYCEIPFARGRSRSCTIQEVVDNVDILIKENKKEIVLTGVNIGDFGKHNGETFLQLIERLDLIEQVKRYRISSIEPDLLTKEIIDFCKQSNSFMPHFHIPLQSGSDLVLKNMNRRYTTEEFRDKVNYIHHLMPHAFIACDVMCGFNSETEEEFEKSYAFLEQLPLAFIHVFTYSDRPDTKAYRIEGKVPMSVRRQRSELLQQLSLKKKASFYKQNIGYKASILWEEENKQGYMFGFTDNYIRVQRPFESHLINQITENCLVDFNEKEGVFIL